MEIDDKKFFGACGHFSSEFVDLNAGVLLLNLQLARLRAELRKKSELTAAEEKAVDDKLRSEHDELVKNLTGKSQAALRETLDKSFS